MICNGERRQSHCATKSAEEFSDVEHEEFQVAFDALKNCYQYFRSQRIVIAYAK